MANVHKGEVSFTSGSESYKLSFSANALVELEEAVGKTVQEISAEFGSPEKFRMKNLRFAFWAGLLDHHPETDLDKAKRILSGLTAMQAVSLVTRAFAAAFPDDEGGGDRPQEPGQAGTGPASSKVGAS